MKFFCALIIGVLTAQSLAAQKKENFHKDYVSLFHFENINNIAYYHNPKELAKAYETLESKNLEKAFDLLARYVSNFGVENFHRDITILWKLASLAESLGKIDLAKDLYRLILKHHRGTDVEKIALHYDSLIKNDKDYYVPLSYYYELVEHRKYVDTLIPPQGVLLDMGPEVNSLAPDYGPVLSPTDDLLLFTSKRNKKRGYRGFTPNEDIFFSKKMYGFWEEAAELKELNTVYNEGSAHITKDGKTIYFSRCESPDGFGSCDLYIAQMQKDSTWKVENLGKNVNSPYWDSHPSLSHNEDTLYFASDRKGGLGLSDIYFTYKLGKDKWAKAQNMGTTINSRKNEVSPFYHPQYHVLYFSSDGHLINFGDFDIFKSYKKKGKWQEPKNLGPLVNGSGSEFYFAIDKNSEHIFYASSDEENIDNLDLKSFPLPMEGFPDANTSLKGSITDSLSGSPFKGIAAIVDLDAKIEIAPKYFRPDGTYEFDLLSGHNYLLILTGEDFFRIEKQFFLKSDTTIHIQTQKFNFSKWQFKSLTFEEGSAELNKDMYADLNKLVKFLADHPKLKLRISGHTNSNGTQNFNQKLSEKRANAVKKYIVKKGNIDKDRIIALGFGNTQPIIKPEVSERDKEINRRVEFEIIKEVTEREN